MKISSFLFRAVCLAFSALLIVMSLSKRAALFDVGQEIDGLEAQLRLEETQAEILRVKLEHRISLEELEAWALSHGMGLPDGEQTEYISMEN